MMKQKTDNKNKVAHMDFETAFTRLEKILETMNEGTTALEPSLALYDEANTLIELTKGPGGDFQCRGRGRVNPPFRD